MVVELVYHTDFNNLFPYKWKKSFVTVNLMQHIDRIMNDKVP